MVPCQLLRPDPVPLAKKLSRTSPASSCWGSHPPAGCTQCADELIAQRLEQTELRDCQLYSQSSDISPGVFQSGQLKVQTACSGPLQLMLGRPNAWSVNSRVPETLCEAPSKTKPMIAPARPPNSPCGRFPFLPWERVEQGRAIESPFVTCWAECRLQSFAWKGLTICSYPFDPFRGRQASKPGVALQLTSFVLHPPIIRQRGAQEQNMV